MGCCCCGQKKEIDPNARRSCTDIFPLLVFGLFLVGMCIITGLAVQQGDIWKIVYGTDSFGNTCGRSNAWKISDSNYSGIDMTNKKYVFPLDIFNPKKTVWLCVEECPKIYIENIEKLIQYTSDTGNHLCFYDMKISDYTSGNFAGPCPQLPVYHSTPVVRRCLPSIAKETTGNVAKEIVEYLNGFEKVPQVLSDVYTCRYHILVMCCGSVVIAFAFVFLLRCFAAFMIYLIFAMLICGILAMVGIFWYYYADGSSFDKLPEVFQNSTLNFDSENHQVLFVGAVGLSVVVVFLVIVVCCVVFNNMQLVVELFHQADRCIKAMPFILFQPLWTFMALVIFVIYWFFVVLLIATAIDVRLPTLRNLKDANMNLTLAEYSIAMPVKYIWWYHFIGLIWVSEFILACQKMVISGSVTIWYFSKQKENLNCAVLKGTHQLVRYHLGSVALGSFIITCVKVPRIVLMYIKKKSETTESLIVKYAFYACICCLYCVEKCLRYISQNAYTVIAIEGRSFCPSAVKACEILVKNSLQFATVNLLGDFVLFIGKCAVTAIIGVACSVIFKRMDDVHYWFVPVIVVCLFAFFVADCLFSIYESVIDTLFICHCEYKSITVEKKEIRINGEVPDVEAVDIALLNFIDKISAIDLDKKDRRHTAERHSAISISERESSV